MSTEHKLVLTKKLAVLLGFEDGTVDVLEHLLTIESSAVRACVRARAQKNEGCQCGSPHAFAT